MGPTRRCSSRVPRTETQEGSQRSVCARTSPPDTHINFMHASTARLFSFRDGSQCTTALRKTSSAAVGLAADATLMMVDQKRANASVEGSRRQVDVVLAAFEKRIYLGWRGFEAPQGYMSIAKGQRDRARCRLLWPQCSLCPTSCMSQTTDVRRDPTWHISSTTMTSSPIGPCSLRCRLCSHCYASSAPDL